MKVIVNTYGIMEDKKFTKLIEGMDELEWRTNEKVIKLIEKRQNEIRYLQKKQKDFKITLSQMLKLKKLTEQHKDWLYFTIEEVDTTRKWCIRDYETSTYIQYLNVADESINFYGFI